MILKILKKVIMVLFFLLVTANTVVLVHVWKKLHQEVYIPSIQLDLFTRDDLTDGEEESGKYTLVYLLPGYRFFNCIDDAPKLNSWNRFRQIRFHIDDKLVWDEFVDFLQPVVIDPKTGRKSQLSICTISVPTKLKVKVLRGKHTVKFRDLFYGKEAVEHFIADNLELGAVAYYKKCESGDVNIFLNVCRIEADRR